MKIKLEDVRLAFPALFEAKTVNGEGEPAFSASFLFPEDHPATKILKAAFETLGKEKWGARWPTVKKEIEAKDRTCLHDGDTKADYAGFPGNLFVSSRNKTRPLVIDRDKSPLVQADGRPYAGCYVNASIELWCQDNNYGKRINASLRGVQFLRDGDAFTGGGSANEDEFDDIADGATADDLV
ncbi:DUF2815 family protein [Ralstonia syzygii subsp. celebesensis]|uniref:DUF2815 domain-containing protein n=2 Tax=Ralstonia syzygii subsp. celebesensis TaxID=1310168 RepID=A0A1U9VFM0_9RALS|nr:DUF2815 family protein [Ralstonia syzygii]AQW29103.1 hypothetical protein B0B51_03135 [blood disease bacterium A2-HR MARDI]QQV54355.1 DUF2815 family protein [Ralstonia syzygii subsp. celebesensis]CCA79388.1 phage protein p50 [blood disease bacterium R229]